MESIVKSLPAAAFCLSHGCKLLRCEPVERGRVDFIFDDPQSSVAEMVTQFFVGGSVSGRDFYRAVMDVRFAAKRTLSGGAR